MTVINEFETIGKLIRDIRRDQKLTQEQLASVCGVGIRFLREVEQGKATCQFGKVFQIIKMLGLDMIIKKRGES